MGASAPRQTSYAHPLLPDIQDEHGDVTRDEHLETGIPGT
jgi:hypothetical protein